MVTVLGRPGRGASQVEKSRLNWATQFLTVAYDDACSPNGSFRMAWISFGVLPCTKRNLMTARMSLLLKSRTSPDMLPFSLCNKKTLGTWTDPSFQRHYQFCLWHWEVGWAKDLSSPHCSEGFSPKIFVESRLLPELKDRVLVRIASCIVRVQLWINCRCECCKTGSAHIYGGGTTRSVSCSARPPFNDGRKSCSLWSSWVWSGCQDLQQFAARN